jgi:hypothetical protein
MASVSGDEDETSGGGGVEAEEGKWRERRGDDDWEPSPGRGGGVRAAWRQGTTERGEVDRRKRSRLRGGEGEPVKGEVMGVVREVGWALITVANLWGRFG